MTEIVLSVSRHQSHCVFSVEFVVFQCRLEEDMLDALIVAFYSYYNSGMVRWWKSKRYTGLCDCGFSRNTRPRQVFSFESNPIQVNFWIVYMHGYRCIQTIFFLLVVLVLVVKLWASYLVCLRNSQTVHVIGSRFFEKMVIIYSWTWAITLNETGTTCA